MTLKTFLLISDDPDDHFEFSEALHEAAPDCVLVSVFDSQKVPDIIASKRVQPDVIFLDLSMTHSNQTELEVLIEQDGYAHITFIPYGGEFSPGEKNVKKLLHKDFSYSELKDFLRLVLQNNS